MCKKMCKKICKKKLKLKCKKKLKLKCVKKKIFFIIYLLELFFLDIFLYI